MEVATQASHEGESVTRIKQLFRRPLESLKLWYLARILHEIRDDMNQYSFPRGFQLEADAGKILLEKEQVVRERNF